LFKKKKAIELQLLFVNPKYAYILAFSRVDTFWSDSLAEKKDPCHLLNYEMEEFLSSNKLKR